jgi:hypothetical protein
MAIGSSSFATGWLGRRDRRGRQTEDVVLEIEAEGGRRRMVEEQRGREAQAGGRGEAVLELDGHERVEAEVVEGALGVDRPRRCAQDGGGLAADEVEQRATAIGLGERREVLGEGRKDAGNGGDGTASGADQTTKERRESGLGAEHGEVEANRNEEGLGARESGIEEGESLLRRERIEAEASHTRHIRAREMSGHRTRRGPIAPGERRGGEAESAAMLSEGIEERIGRSVVGLTRSAEDTGGRREEDEGGEIEVLGELVEVKGGIHLGGEDPIHPLGRKRGDEAVVEGTCGVNDRAERMVVWDRREEGGERIAIGDVASDDGDVCALRREGRAAGYPRPEKRGLVAR